MRAGSRPATAAPARGSLIDHCSASARYGSAQGAASLRDRSSTATVPVRFQLPRCSITIMFGG
eukprot:COSAG02_NODE_3667_length_6400_cov_3.774480_5_plen_63_part_00